MQKFLEPAKKDVDFGEDDPFQTLFVKNKKLASKGGPNSRGKS